MDGDKQRACPRATHDALKRSPSAFRAGTEHTYLFETLLPGGERVVGGRCRQCRSDLAVTVRAGVPLEVVGRLFGCDVSASGAVAEVA